MRLAWLDALRGIAALCVVFDHLTYSVLRPLRDSVYHWFDPGQYGVLAWLGLVSYSLYLLHPALIEVYESVPWTRNENFVPTELLLVAVFVLVLLVCCWLTHRYIEAPMQRLGRRVAGRLDARFGPDAQRSLRPRSERAAGSPHATAGPSALEV